MDEIEFSALIDCRFPYSDRDEASWLINLACQLSPNAAFMIAEELARPPAGKHIPEDQLLGLLDELDQKFNHPVKPLILSISRRMIRKQAIAEAEALEALDLLKAYPGLYSAAGIAFFCRPKEESWERIEAKYQETIDYWGSKL